MRAVKILIPVLFVFVCCSCIHLFFEKPTVALRKVNAVPSLQGLNLNFGLDVNNPNGYDLKLEQLNFNLLINENPSGTGQIDTPIFLPARSSSYVEIAVVADMKSVGYCISEILKGLKGKELRYRVEGDALVKALLGEKNFHFNREGVLTREMLKR